MLNSGKKRDKKSIAITSTFFTLFWCTTRNYLCSLLFLIYTNNLSNHIVSRIKQIAADDILFFIAHNPTTSADELDSD